MFLPDLAVNRQASASTQNQAMNANVFLGNRILNTELPDFDFRPSKVGTRLPIVFTRNELQNIFKNLQGEVILWLHYYTAVPQFK